MSERCPSIAPIDLTVESRAYYDRAAPVARSLQGKLTAILPNGALHGPYNAHLRTPDTGLIFQDLSDHIFTMPGMTARLREVVIMYLAASKKCEFMMYAHTRLARTDAGFSPEVIMKLSRGQRGDGETWDQQCDLAFEVTQALVEEAGPLRADVWDRAIKVLGRDALFAVINLVGLYSYQAVMLNAWDMRKPDGEIVIDL